MFFLLGICFVILFWECHTIKDTLKKKNLVFVENLKQDLRRNNDDYAEMKAKFTETNSTIQSLDPPNLNNVRYKIITTRGIKRITKSNLINNRIYSGALNVTAYNRASKKDKEDARIKIIDNIRRRVNNALQSKELVDNDISDQQKLAKTGKNQQGGSNNTGVLSDSNQPRMRSLWNQMHNFMQKDSINQHRIRVFPNKTIDLSPFPTLKTIQVTLLTTTKTKRKKKHMKKSKMETLKKFILKNKGMLKEFISSKKLAERMGTSTPTIQQTQTPTQKHTKESARALNKMVRQIDVGVQNHKKSLEELPNANMLDMFPAKGGRIHSKRVKGHLCHRHVLIPEGPKYNSLGHIYLPPHAAAGIAHEYNSTDIPKLLLPRCCNCCRKSVLGCE